LHSGELTVKVSPLRAFIPSNLLIAEALHIKVFKTKELEVLLATHRRGSTLDSCLDCIVGVKGRLREDRLALTLACLCRGCLQGGECLARHFGRGHFHPRLQIQPADVLNQLRNTNPGDSSPEQVAHVRLVRLQGGYQVGLRESLLLDVLDQRLPDLRLDLHLQRLRRGEAEVVEEVAPGDVSRLMVCAFHVAPAAIKIDIPCRLRLKPLGSQRD
jgi:hypothetical protein